MKSRIAVLAVLLFLPFLSAKAQYRTVIDKEAGSVFQIPNGFSYDEYGAFIGSAPHGSLDASALSVYFARFDKFSLSDDTMVRGFPYSGLRTYESQQVAAGKAPIFVTATYAGKKRPVVFSWSLGLVNGIATAPTKNWQYAVNVGDPRFVNFWINRYIRPIVWAPSYSVNNVWFELDECAFGWGVLGVLDDSKKFIPNVKWDSPFPQSEGAYLDSVASFFDQVKQIAPDVKTLPNVGSISDPTKFLTVYDSVPGALSEDVYSWIADRTAYHRNAWYTQIFNGFSWIGAQGKIGIVRAKIPAGDEHALLTSFAIYSLLKGPNFFFAPGDETTNVSTNLSAWMPMKSALGFPTALATSTQLSSAGVGYRLYSRTFNNGAVYLNMTGSTQTVVMDPRYKHYDPTGKFVTQISIPDGIGTYVVTTPLKVLQAPAISPRLSTMGTDPVWVTIRSENPSATIRYTIGGDKLGLDSPIYTGPFQLSGNALVQAGAYLKGDSPSWASSAMFQVAAATPTAEFVSASHAGPSGAYFPVLSLSAIPVETVTVHYTVRAPTGATTTGTATFLPGNPYRYFPITVSGAVGSVTTVTINSVTGGGLGTTHTLSYTVQ